MASVRKAACGPPFAWVRQLQCASTLQAMKVYQVGGAVRDRLLGMTAVDRDWVVVGAGA